MSHDYEQIDDKKKMRSELSAQAKPDDFQAIDNINRDVDNQYQGIDDAQQDLVDLYQQQSHLQLQIREVEKNSQCVPLTKASV